MQPQQVSCVSVEGIRGSIFAMATILSSISGLHLDPDTVLSTNISNNNNNTSKQTKDQTGIDRIKANTTESAFLIFSLHYFSGIGRNFKCFFMFVDT